MNQSVILANGIEIPDMANVPNDLRSLQFVIEQQQGVFNHKFRMPVGRGLYYSLAVFSPREPVEEAATVRFNTAINGKDIHDNETILPYTRFFEHRPSAKVQIMGWGGETFNIRVDSSNADPNVNVKLFFTFEYTQNFGLVG